MVVSYTWPSITGFSLCFLGYSSPLPQSLKSPARNLAFGMDQLYQRSPWTPSLCRHRRSCAEPSQWETCLTYIRTAIFHHLKTSRMSRELLSRAFLEKESFQKHLDHVILERTINPVPRLLSHRNPLLFIPKKPSVYGGHIGVESIQWCRKKDLPVGYETTCFLAVATRMRSTGQCCTATSASPTDPCCLVAFPDRLSISVSSLQHW